MGGVISSMLLSDQPFLLVEVAQAVTMRIAHDHRVGVWNIQSGFDDIRRYQDIEPSSIKSTRVCSRVCCPSAHSAATLASGTQYNSTISQIFHPVMDKEHLGMSHLVFDSLRWLVRKAYFCILVVCLMEVRMTVRSRAPLGKIEGTGMGVAVKVSGRHTIMDRIFSLQPLQIFALTISKPRSLNAILVQ